MHLGFYCLKKKGHKLAIVMGDAGSAEVIINTSNMIMNLSHKISWLTVAVLSSANFWGK